MRLALTAAFLCGCVAPISFSPIFYTANGLEVVEKAIDGNTSIGVVDPKRACGSDSFGTFVVTNKRADTSDSAIWSSSVPLPPRMDQQLTPHAIALCKWYLSR